MRAGIAATIKLPVIRPRPGSMRCCPSRNAQPVAQMRGHATAANRTTCNLWHLWANMPATLIPPQPLVGLRLNALQRTGSRFRTPASRTPVRLCSRLRDGPAAPAQILVVGVRYALFAFCGSFFTSMISLIGTLLLWSRRHQDCSHATCPAPPQRSSASIAAFCRVQLGFRRAS